jgi:template-activating factor I
MRCVVTERRGQMDLMPVFEKRRPVLKSIPKFWPVALMNHSLIAYHVQHNADQLAFSYLEDVWVTRDSGEPKCFTIELVCYFCNVIIWCQRFFHQSFGENPFFTNTVLKKEFKFVPPPELADAQAGPDGISEANLQFAWDRDVYPTVSLIIRIHVL